MENLRAQAHPDSSVHPLMDTVIDYFHGRLDPEAMESVQEHLARCQACAALVLDLESFSAAELSAPEDAAAGRLLARGVRQRLRADRWRAVTALAAALLIAALVPLVLVSIGGRRQAAPPAASRLLPEANLLIASLIPRSSLRGGAETNRLGLAPGHRLVGLVLTSGEISGARDFSLALVDSSGRQALVLHGLRPTPTGTFNVGLPAGLLPPGRYQLRLTALRNGAPSAVETYDLEVGPAAAPRSPQPDSP
ncbi:MAG TPA: zf-HC2 domain-containing protein [Thermoanaerobaculia bacterium]|nr:zf-HC2 domain-containing protein [Thermoanaerobaculia bacterium]